MFGIDLRSDTPYRGRRAPAGAVLGGMGMEDGNDASTPDSVEVEVNPTIDDVDGDRLFWEKVKNNYGLTEDVAVEGEDLQDKLYDKKITPDQAIKYVAEFSGELPPSRVDGGGCRKNTYKKSRKGRKSKRRNVRRSRKKHTRRRRR